MSEDKVISLADHSRPMPYAPPKGPEAQAVVQDFVRAQLHKLAESANGHPDQSFSVICMENGVARVVRLGVISAGLYTEALRDELFEMDVLRYESRQMVGAGTIHEYEGDDE